MSAALGTLDGNNQNPIIANCQHNRKDFEYIRKLQELEKTVEDEIYSYESKFIPILTSWYSRCCVISTILSNLSL
jgi:hypothetical protein